MIIDGSTCCEIEHIHEEIISLEGALQWNNKANNLIHTYHDNEHTYHDNEHTYHDNEQTLKRKLIHHLLFNNFRNINYTVAKDKDCTLL